MPLFGLMKQPFFWIVYSRLLLELNKLPIKKILTLDKKSILFKKIPLCNSTVLVQEVDNFPLYDFSTSTKFLVGNVTSIHV